MKSVCLKCQRSYEKTSSSQSRCPICQRDKDAERTSERGTPTQRGYDATYRRNRNILLSDENAACRICGSREKLTADHIVPLNQGGTNDLFNLEVYCLSCNSSKQQKTQAEYIRWLRARAERLGRA